MCARLPTSAFYLWKATEGIRGFSTLLGFHTKQGWAVAFCKSDEDINVAYDPQVRRVIGKERQEGGGLGRDATRSDYATEGNRQGGRGWGYAPATLTVTE